MVRLRGSELLGMVDGLMNGRARRAQMREFRINTVAAQHISCRDCPGGALVSDRALQDHPVDAAGRGVGRRIHHILEATIDDRFKLIELRLRLLGECVAISLVTPILPASRATLITRPAEASGMGVAILA